MDRKRIKNNHGFTLIELLISLLITALILDAMLTCLESYKQIHQQVNNSHQNDWYQFMTLMNVELNQFQVIDANNQYIRVREKKPKPKRFDIICKNHKIYKTSGFHPYLYHVKNWQVIIIEDLIYIEVVFDNGELFSGFLEFEGAGEVETS